MTTLRVGVIGLGAFAESHLKAFAGIPGVEVTAVASRSLARAGEVARTYGIPNFHGSYQELIDNPEVDAVTICTEESAHVAPTVAALVANKHVLLEKPLATTRDDALTILEAARLSSAILMPAHIVRFESRFAALKQAVTEGRLGKIASMHASRNRPRNTLETYGRCHPALVTAIHDLDIMLWLSGELPTRVTANHRLERDTNGVYGVWVTLNFPSGAIATIEATWMMPIETGMANNDTFSVIGTRGSANLDLGLSGVRLLEPRSTTIPDNGYEPSVHGTIAGALQSELMHFVHRATTSDVVPVVTSEDGVRAVFLAESIIQSAETDREIYLDWPNELLLTN